MAQVKNHLSDALLRQKEELLAAEKEKAEAEKPADTEDDTSEVDIDIDAGYGIEMNDELIQEIESTITLDADQAAKMREEAAAMAAGTALL